MSRRPDDPPPRRRRQRGPDPGPRRLAEGLDEALARLEPPGDRPAAGSLPAVSAVFTRWEEVVGPGLARHAWPLKLSGGVLVVGVDHPAWATQVRSLGADLLARVGEVCGRRPERLQVTVRGRPPAPGTHPGGGGVG